MRQEVVDLYLIIEINVDIEEIQKYCNTKKEVTESFPFDDVTLVFKVANKMFCLASITLPLRINLKCDPEKAI